MVKPTKILKLSVPFALFVVGILHVYRNKAVKVKWLQFHIVEKAIKGTVLAPTSRRRRFLF